MKGVSSEKVVQPLLTLIPPGIEAVVMAVADQHAAARKKAKGKAGRKSMLDPFRAAAQRGEMPGLLEFNSAVNYTYNRKAERVYLLAKSGDIAGLEAIEVAGSNTYAKAVRGYRDLMVAFLKGGAA